MSARILLVEDDSSLQRVLLEATALRGYQAEGVSTAELAIERLTAHAYDIVITDINLPGMSGLDLLPHCFRLRPNIYAVVITAYGTIEIAVEAMKRGASDFLTKPIALSDLASAIQVAAERVAPTNVVNRQVVESTAVVGRSAAIVRVLAQVNTVATYNSTVLITGETGTGKELIAKQIHDSSERKGRPMVAFNCAAVPENLLEDELFGHVKGAFTGAQSTREGRFERAEKGTLFLDEIGDMSLPLQSKLLRVLQEREFEKIGSSRPIKVDVRVVAATSADLDAMIAKGTFRSDLYYRLNVVSVRVPPLRERREDIPVLAEHLLGRFVASAGLPNKTISTDAMAALSSYRWPGNVRQLQNAMERAAIFTGAVTVIEQKDLPEEIRSGSPSGITPVLAVEPLLPHDRTIPEGGLSFETVVTNVERELLLQSLSRTGGNKLRAAKLLNMKRTTFVEKLKRLQINTAGDTEEDDDDVA
jgi:DNA-binding NtrC family response regulator